MQTEVIDKEGRVMGCFKDGDSALKWAKANLHGEQDSSDDYEEPNGWDIRPAEQK